MSILPDDITCTCGEGSSVSVNSACVGGGILYVSVNSAYVGGGISNMSVNSAYAGGGVSTLSRDVMFQRTAVDGFPSQIPTWKINYN